MHQRPRAHGIPFVCANPPHAPERPSTMEHPTLNQPHYKATCHVLAPHASSPTRTPRQRYP
eukprot:13617208-Alexandrium_andersonii.AAC.2